MAFQIERIRHDGAKVMPIRAMPTVKPSIAHITLAWGWGGQLHRGGCDTQTQFAMVSRHRDAMAKLDGYPDPNGHTDGRTKTILTVVR